MCNSPSQVRLQPQETGRDEGGEEEVKDVVNMSTVAMNEVRMARKRAK